MSTRGKKILNDARKTTNISDDEEDEPLRVAPMQMLGAMKTTKALTKPSLIYVRDLS